MWYCQVVLYGMRLDSRLQKSRHGIYYLRLQKNGMDRRWSLRTRDPKVAAVVAHEFSAKLINMTIDNIRRPFGWDLKFDGKTLEVKTDDSDADRFSGSKLALDIIERLYFSKQNSEKLDPEISSNYSVNLSDAISEYFQYMLSVKTMGVKTKGEAIVALKKLVALLGPNFRMNKFTNSNVRSEWMFKRKLEKSNRNLFNNDEMVVVKGKPVKDEVSWATVEKELSWIRGFSKWASDEDRRYCESVLTLTIPEGEGINNSYEKFTKLELKSIFDALPFAASEAWQFWILVIGLYTGSRVGEPAALLVSHFERESKLDIMFLPGTKTDCSPRHVPIHPELIELGLLDYVEHRRRSGCSRLFDCPISETNGAGAVPSKWFGAFLDSVNIKSKTKVFHSFRHTLIALLKSRGSDLEARCQYVGHGSVGSSVHRSYGGEGAGLGMPVIKSRVIDLIDWYEYYEWSLDMKNLKLKASTFIK